MKFSSNLTPVKHGLANSESVSIEFYKQLRSYETGTSINMRFFWAQNKLRMNYRNISMRNCYSREPIDVFHKIVRTLSQHED